MTMLRRFIPLSLMCLGVMMGAIFAVSDRTPQASAMQESWRSEDCAMPCFLGIRPGVTTQSEALDLLQKNDWIARLTWFETSPGNGGMNWSWNEHAPVAFHLAALPEGSGRITTTAGVVSDIEVMTSISTGELWLAWGEPTLYSTTTTLGMIGAAPELAFTMVYPEQDFWFTASIGCPYYPQFWDNEVTFLHWTDLKQVKSYMLDDLHNRQFVQQVAARNREECGP